MRGKIIARGYNRRNTDKSPLAHAEISAIKKGQQKAGWLAAGRMYSLCDTGAMSDVCRCDHPVPDSKSGGGLHESKGRLCRIGAESFGCAGIQSPGWSKDQSLRRRMQPDDEAIFQRASCEAENEKEITSLWIRVRIPFWQMDRQSKAARECHWEIQCGRLKPYGNKLTSCIFEKQGRSQTHQRTHTDDRYDRNCKHDHKRVVSFWIYDRKSFHFWQMVLQERNQG